jgi:hypothetical protein
LPNPDPVNGGGGYNGGRLTVELTRDPFPITLHELFHAFLDGRKADIARTAVDVSGLDAETLNEAIAYAFSPGLFELRPPDHDPLGAAVSSDFRSGKPLEDSYTRFRRFGLALRPLLRDALEDPKQTLSTFLPRAIDVWRALREVEAARYQAELHVATVIALHGPRSPSLPDWLKAEEARHPGSTEILIGVKEWIPGTHEQMRDFYQRASHNFLFVASGYPDVRGQLTGRMVSSGDGSFQAYGLEVMPEDAAKVAAGVAYTVKPLNTNDRYRWQVSDQLAPLKLKD